MTKLRILTAAALGVTMIMAPVGGFAKDNPGKGNKKHKAKHAQTQVEVRTRNVSRDRYIVQTNRAVVVNCPPGLAKKDPACVPPGQAKKGLTHGVTVGDILDLDNIHIIRQPGLYGLGDPPDGNRYAIVDGRLVRVESETGRLLSIIRLVNAILD